LKEFSFRKIISIFEHDGREQYEKDDIFHSFISEKVRIKYISKNKYKQADQATQNDSDRSLLQIVELSYNKKLPFDEQ
jgi:hypothetical protein